MNWAILNGEIIEREQAKVDIEDRGYQFGDGVYEVIRVYNGKMFTAKEHLDRLFRSTKGIEINHDYTQEQLTAMLEELIRKNQLSQGIIYLQVSRGVSPRNHAFPKGKVPPSLAAYTKELSRPLENFNKGVRTILTEDIRWLRCDIKSLNLLGNVLAKQKAAQDGCYEAVMHRGNDVTEGSSSNIFIVKNGIVITHESDNLILKGITKEVILTICKANQIPVEERTFTIEELKNADEVFLSSTTSEVTPVIEMDGAIAGGGTPGPITRKLQDLFTVEIQKQCGALSS
jgi:D-alanine transaminase